MQTTTDEFHKWWLSTGQFIGAASRAESEEVKTMFKDFANEIFEEVRDDSVAQAEIATLEERVEQLENKIEGFTAKMHKIKKLSTV